MSCFMGDFFWLGYLKFLRAHCLWLIEKPATSSPSSTLEDYTWQPSCGLAWMRQTHYIENASLEKKKKNTLYLKGCAVCFITNA